MLRAQYSGAADLRAEAQDVLCGEWGGFHCDCQQASKVRLTVINVTLARYRKQAASPQ